MKLTILILCFNENQMILKTIQEARSINIDKEIIIVDNCSTDGTKEILEGLMNEQDLRIVLHSKNMGVGYSAAEGIGLAKGEYIYAPGADLEYKMNDLYKMFDQVKNDGLDVVFGSRLIERKGVSVFQLVKERPYWLGSIISTALINMLYCRNLTDIIATKLIKTSILKKFNFRSHSQAFEFELVSRICKGGFKIQEVPVWYKPRTHKEGKTIKVLDMIPAILAIIRIKILG